MPNKDKMPFCGFINMGGKKTSLCPFLNSKRIQRTLIAAANYVEREGEEWKGRRQVGMRFFTLNLL